MQYVICGIVAFEFLLSGYFIQLVKLDNIVTFMYSPNSAQKNKLLPKLFINIYANIFET